MWRGGCAGQPELTLPAGAGASERAGWREGGCRGAAVDPGSLRAATSAAFGGLGRLRACAGRGGAREWPRASGGCQRRRGGAAGPRGWAGRNDSGGVAALGLGWGRRGGSGGSGAAKCRRAAVLRALEPRPAGPEAARRCPALPAAALGLRAPPEAMATRGARRGMSEGELRCRCWEAGCAHPWSLLGTPLLAI